MRIGIIVAMQVELDLLLPLINEIKTIKHTGVTLHEGMIGDKMVCLMQSGIGKVNAAVGAMQLIRYFNPDIVVNTGVAGGTGTEARVLDVVVGERVAYHDVWCGEPNERGQVQGYPRYFEAPSDILALECLNDNRRIKRGLIATGDIFVDSAEALAAIKAVYPDVMAVDMESAAIAHVCYLAAIPFLSIRVVSDTPGVADNSTQYRNFWTEAPRQTFHVLTELLNEL